MIENKNVGQFKDLSLIALREMSRDTWTRMRILFNCPEIQTRVLSLDA